MNSKELRLFKEAYDSVYTSQTEKLQESVEELDETAMREDPRMGGRKKPSPVDAEKSIPLPTPRGPRKPMPEPTKGRTDQLPKRTKENAGKVEYYKDDVDLFDIVKGYLMSEGYADTEEAALAIMANMSEEWRQSIVEQLDPDATGGNYDDFIKLHQIKRMMDNMTPSQQKKYLDGLPRVGPDGKPLKRA